MKNNILLAPATNLARQPASEDAPFLRILTADPTFTVDHKSYEKTTDHDAIFAEDAQQGTKDVRTAETAPYNEYEQRLITQHIELFPRIVGRLVFKMGARQLDAEDAAQEAFLTAWQERKTLEAEGNPDLPGLAPEWLHATALNRIRNRWRLDKKYLLTTLAEKSQTFESDGADYRATLDLLTQAISSLQGTKRDIARCLLRKAADEAFCTDEEISAEVGIKVSSVRKLKVRMRSDLEAILLEQGLDVNHR